MAKATETEEISFEQTEIEEDNDAEMQSVLAEFDKTEENVKLQIKVYRVAGGQSVKGQRERFLFYADPSEFPILDRVRDTYGSGIYRVRIYKTVGNRTGLVRSFDFDIEAPEPKSAPVNSNSSDLALVLSAMREEQAATRALLERAMERPREEMRVGFDPMVMVEKTISMASNLAGLKSDKSSGLSVENMMALISKGMEIGQQSAANGGGDGGSKGIMDIIDSALRSPLVSDILSRQLTPAPPGFNPGAGPMNFQPQPQTSMPIVPVNPASPQTAIPPTNVFFAQIVSQLGEQARRGIDVAQVVPWVDAHVPAAWVGEILNDPLTLDRLSGGFPIVREFRGWFAALLNELRQRDSEDFDEHGGGSLDDPGRDTGNSRDAQNHASSGTQGHS